jgi:hypothetical protein
MKAKDLKPGDVFMIPKVLRWTICQKNNISRCAFLGSNLSMPTRFIVYSGGRCITVFSNTFIKIK